MRIEKAWIAACLLLLVGCATASNRPPQACLATCGEPLPEPPPEPAAQQQL